MNKRIKSLKLSRLQTLVKNPSDALGFMLDGLENHKGLNIHIEMSTYGAFDINGWNVKGLCFGCAATCAVLQANPHIKAEDLISKTINADLNSDWKDFETIINNLRLGDLENLMDWMDVADPDQRRYLQQTYRGKLHAIRNDLDPKSLEKYYELYIDLLYLGL